MKKINYIIAIFSVVFLSSCEEVIELDLDESTPELVIDAGIVWDTNTSGTDQTITISKSKSYFNNDSAPAVSNAVVTIKNLSTNTQFDFVETVANSGQYICNNFVPVINDSYQLSVNHDNIIYEATETLISTPIIDSLKIKYTKQQFNPEFPVTDVKFKFQDNVNEENYYLYAVKAESQFIYEYNIISDEFSNGNDIEGVHFEDELPEGTTYNVQHMGISKRYYEYLNVLLAIAQASGNPFDASASQKPSGNIINTSDNSNNPNGFFRLSQLIQIDSTPNFVNPDGSVINN